MAPNDQTVLLIVGAIIVYFLFIRKSKPEGFREYLDDMTAPSVAPVMVEAPTIPTIPAVQVAAKAEPEGVATSGNFASPVDTLTLDVNMSDPANTRYANQMGESRPKLTSSDLLPGYTNDKWFDNPDVGIRVEDANLLADATSKVGVDTVGQTRKNPAYDLRGTIPCPKFVVSPWNNSTIEPDINLKSLY